MSLGNGRWSWWLSCLTLMLAGCGRVQDSGRVPSSPSAEEATGKPESKLPPASPGYEAAPVMPSQPSMEAERDEAATQGPAPAKSETAGAPRVSPAPASAPKSKRAADGRREAAGKPGAMTQETSAAPAFAEPPELRDALLEFESQLQKLSASPTCDDACRALESMRRSAARICELVIASDPRARCRSAKERLEQASRDLQSRCTDCR